MIELRISELEAGQRLDKFLKKFLRDAPSGFLYKMLRKKNIIYNGKKADGHELLDEGDQVRFFLADETILKFGGYLPEKAEMEENTGQRGDVLIENAQDHWQKKVEHWRRCREQLERQTGPLKILFENPHVLIVNKPYGVLTQGAESGEISLNDWLIGHLLQDGAISPGQLRTFRPSVCHRLDRNTTGMVICGKTLRGSQEISRLLKERKIQKYYQAYVKGKVTHGAVLQGYLQKDGRVNKAHLVSEEAGGEWIHTEYLPLQTAEDKTLLEIHLITGKTHQIRLHLSSIGHPILGDYKYGDRKFNDRYKRQYGISGQLLHAGRLEFPVMGDAWKDMSGLVAESPLPEWFKETVL